MGLKILVFPTILGLSLLLITVFVYPDVTKILEQQAIKITKEEALAQVESVEGNIKSMATSLDSKKDLEALAQRYYPKEMDQERAVDTVNFLAQQSGVIVSGLIFTKETLKKKVVVSAVSATDETTGDSGEGLNILDNTESVAEPPKNYEVEVTVIGPYENIREFFERLYRTDRLKVTKTLSIQEIASKTAEGGIPDNYLQGNATFDFRYLLVKRSGNVLHHPLFRSDSIDFSSMNRLADFINSPVSDLVLPITGRSNPFEKLP